MKILTLNSHEAAVYLLSQLGYPMDVIDFLPGRYTRSWDKRIRPIPSNVQIITLEEAHKRKYDVAITHSITDLLDIKNIDVPKILRINVSLTGYISQEGNRVDPNTVRHVLKIYLRKTKTTVVAISQMKAKTWGIEDYIVIPNFVDVDFFNGYTGEISSGLRVVNQIINKSKILDIEFFVKMIEGLPFRIVGHNPDLPGVKAASNIYELRELYRKYRFYVHTARYDYEDGYNNASLEAMATGMPVICNEHPTAPIIDGINGFISSDPYELKQKALALLKDKELAKKLGKNAREYVKEHFSFAKFKTGWEKAFEIALKNTHNY
ncbi:MAG: hypothetical protein DRP91_07060 [Candidatus Neomarinimicrobiota bacterium]|nr:glycosyltransferase family 4 protein [Candidatus Neomarinimicrobiota bacterium]RKY47769.1 MAG: hypothetical protein DRP91_07060 [Candidatus Neomarinimicrobiota bacterium]RKY53179.1 MAG: hypothetical protein DRP92_04015 [Candidatus Neomarinimicrobiota bacterium]